MTRVDVSSCSLAYHDVCKPMESATFAGVWRSNERVYVLLDIAQQCECRLSNGTTSLQAMLLMGDKCFWRLPSIVSSPAAPDCLPQFWCGTSDRDCPPSQGPKRPSSAGVAQSMLVFGCSFSVLQKADQSLLSDVWMHGFGTCSASCLGAHQP